MSNDVRRFWSALPFFTVPFFVFPLFSRIFTVYPNRKKGQGLSADFCSPGLPHIPAEQSLHRLLETLNLTGRKACSEAVFVRRSCDEPTEFQGIPAFAFGDFR
jgi:hypothetical protein